MVTASKENRRVWELLGRMRGVRPRSREELAAYVETFLGIRIPARRVCAGHDSPMDYLAWSFLGEGAENGQAGGRDGVVWANRGGGKTRLGAVATLLEGVFAQGCRVRILGGSEEQSQRMYEHLREGLDRGYEDFVVGSLTQRGGRFRGGGDVQVLTQSETSVRGHHVQRLRCDELELFDREVWQAAQFVTQSRGAIEGRLECYSTMHQPYGLMSELIGTAGQRGMRVFKWCLWEVIERCRDRVCSRCALWEDCQGVAKEGVGYYRVEDAIAQKQRSSRSGWEAEMLCRRPYSDDLVFAEFNPAVHVGEANYDPKLPLYRSIDFGFRNPLACLFIQYDGERDRAIVIDEHLKSRTTLAEHARLIKARYPQRVAATYCDPAGRQRNEITGTALTAELAALGMPVRWRGSRVLDGIELIRRYLSPAQGAARLVVGRRCEQLIRAFGSLRYRREASGARAEVPEKDGVHDHVIDALRYFFVNRLGRDGTIKEKSY